MAPQAASCTRSPLRPKTALEESIYICLGIQHRISEFMARITGEFADFALTPDSSNQAGLYFSSLCNSTSFMLC